MSNKAHRARRDTSEPEVIRALETCGWTVWKMAQKGIPDLFVFQRGGPYSFVEVKTGKGKLRSTQNWDEQGLRVAVLRCAEDVFSWHHGERTGSAR